MAALTNDHSQDALFLDALEVSVAIAKSAHI